MDIILHLSHYWWTAETLPFPSVTTIAKAIGVTPRTVQKRITALQEFGLTERRNTRFGSDTNLYSFKGLIRAALPYPEEKLATRAKRAESEKKTGSPARSRSSLSCRLTGAERDRGVACPSSRAWAVGRRKACRGFDETSISLNGMFGSAIGVVRYADNSFVDLP